MRIRMMSPRRTSTSLLRNARSQAHYHNAIVKSPVIDGQDDLVWASEETMYDRRVEQDSQGSYQNAVEGRLRLSQPIVSCTRLGHSVSALPRR